MFTAPNGDRFLTVKEAAEMTGVSYYTISRAIRNGGLEARTKRGTKSPRFVSEAALNAWFETGFDPVIKEGA